MIHPHTRLVFIDEEIGYGVFATQFIPKGTITYVKDTLELEISPRQFSSYPPVLQQAIDKYSYIDERGMRIVSWDLGKYVNHCCHCNTMSTGYGFEIAIRDIHPGEEITDEYGLFNIETPMEVHCKWPDCRRRICKEDLERLYPVWDEQVRQALAHCLEVEQPLQPLIDPSTWRKVEQFLVDPSQYLSVSHLRYDPSKFNGENVAIE